MINYFSKTITALQEQYLFISIERLNLLLLTACLGIKLDFTATIKQIYSADFLPFAIRF